jgi:hypothetical protein
MLGGEVKINGSARIKEKILKNIQKCEKIEIMPIKI